MNSSDSLQLSDVLSSESPLLQSLTSDQKLRLTVVLDEYLRALDGAVPMDVERLLRDQPDLAGALRVYLKSLAVMHEATAAFGPALPHSSPGTAPAVGDEQRLGDFAIVREVGRGGMGVVYEARQLSLGRRVALKILPFAAVLDARQIARFKNEAHAAAQLHHPNIVPVFAVGTERGVHYYAMQFIDGQPLDRAIREMQPASADVQDAPSAGSSESTAPHSTGTTPAAAGHGSYLSPRSADRREYFRSVVTLGIQAAEALHAAHDSGVVHRDIKPSNLLLDGEGKLWITDFGLARCHNDASLTRTGDIVGTRRYMSPEQALGQAALVDQRTDVYSLGVTLYELLTLRRAFEGDDGPMLIRRISHDEPIRPMLLQPRLPRDLETVVLKAMARQKEDRYLTAQELADDLRRVLEGKPTVARPPSIPDRFGKWARRHSRAATAVAAAGLLALIGLGTGTLLVTREKIRAEQNYERAERNFRQAEGAVDRFGARLAERLAELPGAEHVRRELLQETLRYYQGFVEQAGNDPALQADLALTYNKIGTVSSEIGYTADAISAHEHALKLFERLVAENPKVAEYRRHVGICQNNLASALCRAGRNDDARATYQDALRWQTQLLDDFPESVRYRGDLALSYNNLGLLQSETGAVQEAKTSFQDAIRLSEEAAQAAPNDPEMLRGLAASYNNLAAVHRNQDPHASAGLYRKASAYLEQAVAAASDARKYQSDLALTLSNLGSAQSRARRFDDASASYRRAIELQQALVQVAPLQRSYHRDLAVSYNNLGLLQTTLRHFAEAERSFRSALERQEKLLTEAPNDLESRSSLGGMYNNLGIVLEELGRFSEAAESYQRAVKRQLAAYSRAPDVERYRSFLSRHYYNYGRVLRQLGKADKAARVAMARKELWPQDPQRLFSVAEELALTSKLLASSAGGDLSARECGDWAVAALQEALAAGLPLPADLDRDEAFAALRVHPEFKRLAQQ